MQTQSDKKIAKKPSEGQPWDVVVVGSGPAAFTAAIYTTRGAASTAILGGEKWGGQLMLTTTIDNFPAHPGIQGPELMQKMKDHATLFGGEFIPSMVTEVDFSKRPFVLTTSSGENYLAKTVIISTGSETKWLGVPGEEVLRGRGVSSCAPCDAPFFKEKNVAVIGGGDSAMEESLVLTKYASSVTIIHRKDEFKASKAMQAKVFELEKQGKIKIVWDSEVVEFIGDGALQGIKVKNIKTDTVEVVPFDGAFVAIGHNPSTEIFQERIELDEKGYVKKIPTEKFQMSTSIPGVFVAGDVHDGHYMQAITASAFGCMAGMEALKFLQDFSV